MNRVEKIKIKVSELYGRKMIGRADWADWLYQNHIFVVAENAKQLAKRFGGNSDIVVVASMLYDIADAIMSRENPEHEEQSKKSRGIFCKNVILVQTRSILLWMMQLNFMDAKTVSYRRLLKEK